MLRVGDNQSTTFTAVLSSFHSKATQTAALWTNVTTPPSKLEFYWAEGTKSLIINTPGLVGQTLAVPNRMDINWVSGVPLYTVTTGLTGTKTHSNVPAADASAPLPFSVYYPSTVKFYDTFNNTQTRLVVSTATLPASGSESIPGQAFIGNRDNLPVFGTRSTILDVTYPVYALSPSSGEFYGDSVVFLLSRK